MKLKIIGLIALLVIIQENVKAQNHQVFEPSSVKYSPLVAEIPGLGSSYIYEHKVTKLSNPGRNLRKDSDNFSLASSAYTELDLANKSGSAIEPNLLRSFQGNVYNSFTPPDNTMAISNDGIIVSSINSNVYYYNTSGKILGFTTFLRLSRDYFDNLSADLFDPRLLYDQEFDRFVLVILSGHSASESQVLIYFSKTNNPMDGWYAYSIAGDVTKASNWLDYPNIAVNKNNLFISGNLFNGNDVFSDNAILKIDKFKGFSGQEITYTSFSGLTSPLGKAFTLVPVEKGTSGNYSEKAWFVCTDGDFANFIMLYELSLTTGKLESTTITVPYYDVANDADQLNTKEKLDMGDSRVKNAILIDNTIHVVHTTATVNKNAAIAYHRIDVFKKTAKTSIYHKDSKKHALGYPSVAAAGTSATDQSVFIAYTEMSANFYPQLGIMSVDANMKESSTVLLKEGAGYIDILQDNIERWGDYITLANRFNNNTCWLFGCIGGENKKHDNYLFEISLDKSASTEQISPSLVIDAFPNPVVESVNIIFELDVRQMVTIGIYNQNGELLETLVRDTFNAGKQQLNFEMSQLASGVYFLKIEGNKGLLAHKQLIK